MTLFKAGLCTDDGEEVPIFFWIALNTDSWPLSTTNLKCFAENLNKSQPLNYAEESYYASKSLSNCGKIYNFNCQFCVQRPVYNHHVVFRRTWMIIYHSMCLSSWSNMLSLIWNKFLVSGHFVPLPLCSQDTSYLFKVRSNFGQW